LLIWTDSAQIDLYDLQLYLVDKDAGLGLRLALKIARGAEILEAQPRLGKRGLLTGTREWAIPGLPYKLVYALEGDNVTILRVIHQARDWP